MAGTSLYTFDARNRMTTGGGAVFTWNARGDLTSQIGGSAGLLQYTYDALDRLTKVSKGVQSVAYTYDGLDRVVSRGTASFAYNGLGLDPVSDGSTLFARSPSGGLMSQSAAGVSSLVATNRHGDVTALFASDGSPRATRVYDPLGNVAGSSGTGSSSLGFQGDFTDATSGGVWMGARWYNPATGVFSVRDSVRGEVVSPGSFNSYSYGWDNPLTLSDPDGHWPAVWDNFVGAVTSWGQGVFAAVSSAVVGQVMSKVSSALAQVSQFISKVADLTGIRSMVAEVVRDPGAALQQGARFLVPMAAGALATGACIGLTSGVGTPVCLALGGAVTGGVAAGMDCRQGSDCVRQVAVGAIAGGVGGLVGGAIGGRVASTLLGRLATGMTAGGLGSGAASITGQLLTTGKIDWRQTGDDILNGMAFGALGGALGGKTTRPATRPAAAGEARIGAGSMSRAPWSKPAGGEEITLYHGTTPANAAKIRAHGIDLGRANPRTDFGAGFYTTSDRAQALARAGGDPAGVLEFKVTRAGLEKLTGLAFTSADESYAAFVRGLRAGQTHSYDYVSGPVLANPRRFYAGEDPITFGDQVSFHTAAAIEMLFKGLQ